ncbi:hypothetical protein, partial [Clostridium perfringens]|uniref:hypothetical protein n=1 Tax=Clostridium perfringens TaxID=1502 RepID=UPI002AC4B0A9
MTDEFNGNIIKCWSPLFWQECLDNTPCRHLNYKHDDKKLKKGSSLEVILNTIEKLKENFYFKLSSTEINPKYDAVFGIALYSLNILKELYECNVNNSIIGRLALRGIVECYIT